MNWCKSCCGGSTLLAGWTNVNGRGAIIHKKYFSAAAQSFSLYCPILRWHAYEKSLANNSKIKLKRLELYWCCATATLPPLQAGTVLTTSVFQRHDNPGLGSEIRHLPQPCVLIQRFKDNGALAVCHVTHKPTYRFWQTHTSLFHTNSSLLLSSAHTHFESRLLLPSLKAHLYWCPLLRAWVEVLYLCVCDCRVDRVPEWDRN